MTISQRITTYHEKSNHEGEFILYWMTSARRSKEILHSKKPSVKETNLKNP